jgi:predicted TIM-barrel fold metal-dependent hydrolase
MLPEMQIRPVVDSHIHLWDLNHLYYDWLTDKIVTDLVVGDYASLGERNYLPEDFLRDLPVGQNVVAVHIECALGESDPVAETQWVGKLAETHRWIGAIVGRGNLSDRRFEELLERHMAASQLFRGIRMLSRPEIWATVEFRKGLRLLADRKLSFDLDADPDSIESAAEMAESCSDVRILLGHAGFPKKRTVEYFQKWRKAMKRIAAFENVACKVSGLGMADHEWTEDSIRPWVEECLECFGTKRCMFGTNWPVDSLYSNYTKVLVSYMRILEHLSDEEQQRFFYQNAMDYYSIGTRPDSTR